MDRLEVSTADEYSDEDLAPFGGVQNVVRSKEPLRVRRMVMIARLQRALGLEGPGVDGFYDEGTHRALMSRLELDDEAATFDERLEALGKLGLGVELETLIIEWWKNNGRGPAQ
jgi:hypothetical protein